MPAPRTAQQRHAVSWRATSVVLSSGAGCGKTSVLTERYLAHLRDDGAEVGQVVAITFTDRAAREMRGRIRKAILAAVHAVPDSAAGARWAGHLRGLETAQISTIHAFCGTLLRQHAVEAGLDPRFDVLEDVLSVNLEGEALTSCLQRLLTADEAAGAGLRELVLLYGWRPVLEAVQHFMRFWDERAWEACTQAPADVLAARWQEYARTDLLPRRMQHLLRANPKVARCLWLLRRTPPKPGSKMAGNVGCLLEELPRLADAADAGAAVERLAELAQVGTERARAWPSEEAYEAVKAAFEAFRKELRGQRLDQFATVPEDLAAAVGVGQRFLRVAAEVGRAYRDLKRTRGVVDFQDLLVLARDLLRDHQAVRERLQRRYRFLLIDELQDTDPVQLELVRLLCAEGLTLGKLFAVGDYKQSIYRFRGADAHLFQALRGEMPSDGRQELTLNFRSQPAILEFTNALLRDHLVPYEKLEPHRPQLNPGPCIEFLWAPRGDAENVTDGRAREAEWIARRIAAMVGRERLVAEDGPAGPVLRPVRSGDVVLLFRAMSNVHLYEAALRNQGLNYYLVGGRAFFAQQEIYDILNLLRTLENPQDAVSLAGALRSPFCCLSDEALFLLGRPTEGLWACLHDGAACARLPADQRAAAERARRHLDRWRGLKDRLPIARLLGEVFADSGYDAALQFEHLGDRKLANLWKLLDLARTFDRSGLFGLAEFIQRLADLVRTQPREEQAATQPENADVVRLMTIHQAKGLEFPVVFVPDIAATGRDPHRPVAHWDARLGAVARPPADEETPPFPDFGWRLWQAQEALEDWHEDLRTLYVACTRARDYLVLSASLRQPVGPTNTWMLTLGDRFDVQSGAFIGPPVDGEAVPPVRVLTSPEELGPAVPVAASARARADRSAGNGKAPAAVAPVPVRLCGKRMFTVAGLQAYRRRRLAFPLGGAEPLRAGDFAVQFGAEDGSDRSNWPRPRDDIDSLNNPQFANRDGLLRAILGRWDYRDEDGWRALLEEVAGSESPVRIREAETLLARFAGSAVCRQMATARAIQHDVEFVAALAEPEGWMVRGLLDCLWQDGGGGRHLLAFATEPVPPAERQDYIKTRKWGLTLAAWAVRQQFKAALKSVTLYTFDDGDAIRWTSRQLPARKVLTEVAALLSDLARQVLPE
jgi:ATP-dependent helicase/nuclease subunit A